MRRKAFIFTLDAVLALVLALIFIASISAVAENTGRVYLTQSHFQNKMIAQHVLDTLRTVPISNLVPSTVIDEWISSGILNLTYVNPQMPPLQIVATYWALANNYSQFKNYSEIILQYLLRSLIKGYSYQLIINNYTSPYLTFGNNYSTAQDVGSATILVSGYSQNALPRGYVAKAYITKLITSQEKLIGIQRVLAGAYYYSGWGRWYENDLNVTFSVSLPNDANITNGTLNLATRSGENVYFYVNNRLVTRTGVQSLNITGELKNGSNVFSAYFTNPPWWADEIGFGSGSWIFMKYKTAYPAIQNPGLVKLYTIESAHTGVYYLNSLFVPGNITGISMKLTVSGVTTVRIYYSNGTSLNLLYTARVNPSTTSEVIVSNSTLVSALKKYTTLSELSKKNFNLVIALDAYYNSNTGKMEYEGQDYNLSYTQERILYGYPNSYINITYIPRVSVTKFMIPLGNIYQLSPDGVTASWNGLPTGMTFSYYLPQNVIPWYVDVWSAIQFTGWPSGTLTLYEGPGANVKVLSEPLDLYLIRIAYTKLLNSIMVPGETNTFRILSDNIDYTFRYEDSRAIVYYFLNGYAPYGNVFPYYSQNNSCGYNLTYYYNFTGTIYNGTVIIGNCKPTETPLSISASELKPLKYALDNAIFRLFVQLGAKNDTLNLPGTRANPIMVNLQGLQIEAIGIRNVPNSIAPIEVTLRIWRG
ncbi:TPM domain-containing protein [Thermococcus sp.]|uniref:TPM domain-containing protein n=1 Tax=Thermococcus sp. TaxID=35749 RepID=UPI0026256FC8|nr:TPM domain-containing protein [Thermococcus sp.]